MLAIFEKFNNTPCDCIGDLTKSFCEEMGVDWGILPKNKAICAYPQVANKKTNQSYILFPHQIGTPWEERYILRQIEGVPCQRINGKLAYEYYTNLLLDKETERKILRRTD